MAKVLIINAEGQNYRLPADTDMSKLAGDIAKGFTDGAAVLIKTEMGDDPTNNGTLILNGNAMPFVALGEAQSDPEPVLDEAL
jgi:hypothetical protein